MDQEIILHQAGSGSVPRRTLHVNGDISQTPTNCTEFGTSLLQFVQPFYFLIWGTDKTMVQILQSHDQGVIPRIPLWFQNPILLQ